VPASLASGPIGLTLDQDPALLGRGRSDGRPALLLPLESSIVELALEGTSQRLDRSVMALLPAQSRYRLASRSPALKLITLAIGDEGIARAQREYRPQLDSATFAAILATPTVLPRTRWVDELAHRYFFERVICERHESAASRFLETELVKELFFLGREQSQSLRRAPAGPDDEGVARRARRWIEEHLFEPLRVDEVARVVHASESTLLRAFHAEYGTTPAAWLRGRRLDEALLLLESGRYGVGETAARVGYTSLAAFTGAFHRRFGAPPSSVRREAPRGATVPPHGATRLKRRKKRTL
jgi:AraC-like DNA-binding protein